MKRLYKSENFCFRIVYAVMIAAGIVICPKGVAGQTVSNEGTEFYAVFPSHVPSRTALGGDVRLANYSIFVTGKSASSGVVSVGSFTETFQVLPNTVTEVKIPRWEAYIDNQEAGTVLSNRAIKILVDSGKPKVVVYGHIFAGARSAASLILPRQALGQRYFSMNYPSSGEGANFIVVVGTEPATRIFLRRNNQDLVSGGITLNAGEVYQYLSVEDLSGTEVIADPVTSSCKSFAMFSGSSNSVIGVGACSGSSLDPLYQQNYPTESWGMEFGFIPFTNNPASAGNFVRVIAGEDNTEVRIGGSLVATLNAGEYYASPDPLRTATFISASKPVAVAQFAVSQICSGLDAGDPDMVLLNPIEYNIRDITVYSSRREAINEKYLNVLIKSTAAPSFRVNGRPPAGTFTALPGAPDYSFIQLSLNGYSTDNFNLTANEGFNAIAYGFGVYESYAYSAGTNLASSQTLAAVRKVTREELPNACTEEEFDFRLMIPEQASQIAWQFENDAVVIQNQADLAPVPVTRNGKALYSYFYPRTHVFNSPGQKVIKVTVTYPTANVCNISQETIEFNFEVYDPPKADFSFTDRNCAASPVQFKDASTAAFKSVSSWSWDFGDGEFSNEQNPAHIFKEAGTYQVKLIAGNDAGCPGDVLTRTVVISAIPSAEFTSSPATCSNNNLTFTVQTSAEVIQWIWDFGDASKLVQQDKYAPIVHQYAHPGTYEVKLTVVNASGCQNTFQAQVRVFAPVLEAGKDLLVLEGDQIRLDVHAEGNGLTYKWFPATGLDRDDVQNPLASPSENTTYTVTIHTAEGCILTDRLTVGVVKKFIVKNTFTPNGDGINDVWTIENLSTNPNAEVNVFNRYGEKLFTSIGYSTPWDGRYQGKELPVGTYYYIIDPKNGHGIKSGAVTILR